MKKKALPILLILAVVLAGAAAAQTEKWIHVRVQSSGDSPDGETVTVNLPLSLITAAAALIPVEEVSDEAEIALDDLNMSWGDLRTFWDAVKDAPEATFVTVQTRDENVEVKKKGDYLLVKTVEAGKHGADIDVKFPLAVIDALLSGPEGTFNFEAAIQALADEGHGNLVSVRDGDETVQVWIDDRNEVD